ncbi:MAG: hypothetical protein HYT61_02035 [Candidatus Yanofskybacteria bacterium]|nr:hypothetical protein [Candidatus Yanofskybacteria bacterium]
MNYLIAGLSGVAVALISKKMGLPLWAALLIYIVGFIIHKVAGFLAETN